MLKVSWSKTLVDPVDTCLKLNKEIEKKKLAIYTWGNVSTKFGEKDIIIKPSGIPFKKIKKDDMSQVNIKSGKLISGKKESVDTLIHLEIYRAFPETRSVIHTHSTYATCFAQARKEIPILGTTHADYFKGIIPVAEQVALSDSIKMETLIGRSIVEKAGSFCNDDEFVKAVLIPSHGPIIWSKKVENIIEYAVVLEEVARLAFLTLSLSPSIKPDNKDSEIFDFHFTRKNGKGKYYGQTVWKTRDT